MKTARRLLTSLVITSLAVPLPAFALGEAVEQRQEPPTSSSPRQGQSADQVRTGEPAPCGAWAWGILLPGLGQIAVGEPGRGALTLGLAAALPVAGFAAGMMAAPQNSMGWDIVVGAAGAAIGLGASTAVWAWGVFDAYHIEQQRQGNKAP